MTTDSFAALLPVVRATLAFALLAAAASPALTAETQTNPTGGGDSVTLEPVPVPQSTRAKRPVFVCRDGASVVFADRPCGQVVETRALEVLAPGPGQAASTVRRPPAAAVRPRVEPQRPLPEPEPGDGRCARLRVQLEALDDRMRTGYTAREAARLWNRWREIKAQIHDARCRMLPVLR